MHLDLDTKKHTHTKEHMHTELNFEIISDSNSKRASRMFYLSKTK